MDVFVNSFRTKTGVSVWKMDIIHFAAKPGCAALRVRVIEVEIHQLQPLVIE